jgi:molybdate-binding protein/DNA-binding transcriptional regulator YhcF (GntR family)
MDEGHLYRKVAEAIRQEILSGQRKPGERLPSIRELAKRWNCTVGTIQHAYRDLSEQGLITSRSGQGTHVVDKPPLVDETPMRRAMLIHRAEAFLLEVLTGGYNLEEVDGAVRQAMDRWRSVVLESAPKDEKTLRFVGSHDLVMTWLASHFEQVAPGCRLQLTFSGSLGGLIALAEGKADLAGSHLWDEESDSYNGPFVRRLLPGKRVALVTIAQRRLGLILPPRNPLGIHKLTDLTRPGLRFINRQSGSGTRVWLDLAMHNAGIDTAAIQGYQTEMITHSAIAQAIAEDKADAGIGLEAAAISHSLDFLFLTHDRYDLVVPAPLMEAPTLQSLLSWLKEPSTHSLIQSLGGYDTHQTGRLEWLG